MYKYYQTGERSRWHPLRDDPRHPEVALNDAAGSGAKKLTILAVSEVVDEFTVKSNLSYKGPLYFDIDCKEDIYQAINSTRALVEKLKGAGVLESCIQVYCSGSKGLHVIVDERAFSSGRAVVGLPHVYKELARELYVFGVDYQVYCLGRGNSFRMPNIQRDDGHFRVQITHEELAKMTLEDYAAYVSGPRSVVPFPSQVDTQHALHLSSLFERAKKTVKAKQNKAQERKQYLTDEQTEALKADTPQCVKSLVDSGTKEEVNFNELALQLAAFCSSSGAPKEVTNSLAAKLANTTTSSTYSSERGRYEHIAGLIEYCKSPGSNYSFYCPAIKSVLKANPCEGCSLDSLKDGQQRAAEGGDSNVVARDDGYYIVSKTGERKVCTFTLTVLDYHAEQQQDGSIERRTGFKAMVHSSGLNCKDKAEIFMSEDMWQSKSSLIRELSGLGSIAFTGNDVDVQQIKHHVYSNQMAEAGQITAVYTAGIVPQKVGTKKLLVYVEPNGSINQLKVQGTHYLNSDLLCPPDLLTQETPQQDDEGLRKALSLIFKVNSGQNLAMMLGWYAAAHYRSHLIDQYRQFPLLSIWGPAGTGKTMLSTELAWLNGCNYTEEYSPITASEATQWALIDYCSTTTTVPRILDEANETKMGRNKYFQFAEILKSSWGNLTIARGSIKKSGSQSRGRTGARTVQIPICAPLVVLSEQAMTMPALQHRSLQVFLTRDSQGGVKGEHYFNELRTVSKHLAKLGKVMMTRALMTPSNDLHPLLEAHRETIPIELESRPRYSYAVALLGLDLLNEACESVGFDVADKISHLKDSLLGFVRGSIDDLRKEKSRTEIDKVLGEMGVMASMAASGMTNGLIEDEHFMFRQGDFIFDFRIAFPLYVQHCARYRQPVIIKDPGQFVLMLKQEPYFVEESMVPGFSNRPVIILNADKMNDKGIDTMLFSKMQRAVI